MREFQRLSLFSLELVFYIYNNDIKPNIGNMEREICSYLNNVFKKEYNIENIDIALETPPKKNMGDFAYGCFSLAKILKKSPNDIAKDIVSFIEKDSENIYISKGEVVGPYVNIFLKDDAVSKSFENFMNSDIYPNKQDNSQESIYIDYIGANVGKPLHIGHMCTPIQGQVIINLFSKLGYNVVSDSHIGDWGIIFGKLIVAYELFGDDAKLRENAVEHLFELYVKISDLADSDENLEGEFRQTFKKLSQGDEKMKDIWKQFTSQSISAMNVLLSRLFVFPKYNIGESFYEGIGLAKMENYPDLKFPMSAIVQELIEKNIAIKNDDRSVGVVFSEDSKLPSCILQKRDGTHGYLASDLASIKYRMDNWNPKKILYFVDVRQKLHFEQAFAISKIAGWVGEETEIHHAYNGFISLKDGAMSTRKGKIIKLEALLDESESRASEIILEKRSDIDGDALIKLSKTIGIGAIKYGYLKKTRESDSIFDWDEFMSFEGNSGPYIQYAYVRAHKILLSEKGEIDNKNLIYKTVEEKNLILHLLGFQNVLIDVSTTYHPHLLCAYAYSAAKLFSVIYANVPISTEKDIHLRKSRYVLLQGYMMVLEECFDILGIPLPLEM